MFELPLFPLNTVLFPGTPIHLHIFEERYKRMIGQCIQEREPFGIALIRSGAEAHGPLAQPYSVGCSANIANVQQLEQGRMNIVAIGQERIRILSLETQAFPYLVGTVQPYPIELSNPDDLSEQASLLNQQVERLLQALVRLSGGQIDLSQLPADPVDLAYVAAALLQIPALEKQALLEQERAGDLLSQVRHLYRREQALFEAMLAHSDKDQGISFSKN